MCMYVGACEVYVAATRIQRCIRHTIVIPSSLQHGSQIRFQVMATKGGKVTLNHWREGIILKRIDLGLVAIRISDRQCAFVFLPHASIRLRHCS
jgi:hypothetical protein